MATSEGSQQQQQQYMMRKESAEGLIGNTPVVLLPRFSTPRVAVWAKVEKNNPGGSVKDRIAFSMVEDAEQTGKLKKGDTIVEATSGNTGIGLAMVGAQRGYHVLLSMPKSVSVERRKLLKAYGAELILVDGGTNVAVAKAEELAKENPSYFYIRQFENPANPRMHERTTGPELVKAFEGDKIDAFVAGVGTGGTITGVGHVLKATYGKDCKIVAVEPDKSPVLSGGKPAPHGIQGIGAGFVPKVLDREALDEIVRVTDNDALDTMRRLAAEEGMHVGVSAGAAVWAAHNYAEKLSAEHASSQRRLNVVTVLPDTGERYLSLISE
eukprot:TRINITY_DN1625_c0_g1_i1.p1 TRINITY_DN1625_c0_g1~~TRINITY_DN1625_c0_g1_i1.p1  ORF type:complete len:346 (+),score=114.93 TRINITY_DN1625_c0_g1_i1:66-1040(+)